MQKYDVDYFIRKFTALPSQWWTENVFINDKNQKCAQGFCGILDYEDRGKIPEAEALINLFGGQNDDNNYIVAIINNGRHIDYQQETPKKRILAALYDIKAKYSAVIVQKPIEENKIVYIIVDQKVRELQEQEPILN